MGDVRLFLSGVLCQSTNDGTQDEQATDRLKIVYHVMREEIPRVDISSFTGTFLVAGSLLRASQINQTG
jgi:hypothetical protein